MSVLEAMKAAVKDKLKDVSVKLFAEGAFAKSMAKVLAAKALLAMACFISFVVLLAGICGACYCCRGAPGPFPHESHFCVGLIRSLVLKCVFLRCLIVVVPHC